MKISLQRLIAAVLLVFLTATLYFQNVALAGPGAEKWNENTVAVNKNHEPSNGSGPSSSGLWPWESQSPWASSKPIREGAININGDARNPQNDRERRDVVKEVTGEPHMPGGGPQ